MLPFNGWGQQRNVPQQQVHVPQVHVLPPPVHAPPPPVVSPWDQQTSVADLWKNRDTRAIYQLKVKTVFQNGLFEYDRTFDVWERKFEILLQELRKAYKSYQGILEKQAIKDARMRKLAIQVGFTVLTIGLSAVGAGVVGELIKNAITSEAATLFVKTAVSVVVEFGQDMAKELTRDITGKIEQNLSSHANSKASKALKEGLHKLDDVDGELERLQDCLKDVIREMKLKYAQIVNNETTAIADNQISLKAEFTAMIRTFSDRMIRNYVDENTPICSKNELYNEMDRWVSRTRRNLDDSLTRLFHCPHDQARNNRAATKKSLEKLLWAEWIIAQAEGKTELARHQIVYRLNQVSDVYRSSNFRLTLANNKQASVLKNIGSEITNELIRLGVVEWRDQRYSAFRSQEERQRLDWEHQAAQSNKVFTGKSIRGQIGGDRAKGRLVMWAHQYLAGEPLKAALGVQQGALQNTGVLQNI